MIRECVWLCSSPRWGIIAGVEIPITTLYTNYLWTCGSYYIIFWRESSQSRLFTLETSSVSWREAPPPH